MLHCLIALLLLASTAAAATVREELARSAVAELDGGRADLDDLEGHTVVVNFWAEWCAPCRRELPVLDAWFDEFEGRAVRFVPISIDRDRGKASRWAERLGLELPLYHDGPDGLASELDLPALPITYVIDPSGETVFTSTGSDDAALASLRAAIARTLDAAEGAAR